MALQAANLSVVVPSWRIVDREPERVGRWVEAHGGGTWGQNSTCIGLERRGELVAGVMYDSFNGASVFTAIAGVGKHWLTREYLWFIFYYPFVQLKANVLVAVVAPDNSASQRFCEHLGFEHGQSIPDGHPAGDLLIYTMHKSKCRWLELKGKRRVLGTQK